MKSAVEWLESEIKKYLQSNSVMNYDSFKDLFARAKEIEHRHKINEVAKMFNDIDGFGITKGLRDYMEGRYQDVINYKKQNFGEEHD
jgi:hypothetical protein